MFFHKLVKVGEIIRSRKTREMFLIVDKVGENLFTINLNSQQDPAPLVVVLPRETEYYDRDIEIDDLEEWEAQTLADKIPELVSFAEEEHATKTI